MTEKQLAENIMKVHGQTLVDNNGGVTIGGADLAEKYFDFFSPMGNTMEIYECATALRHWVASAGYDMNGKFKFTMADYIQNC